MNDHSLEMYIKNLSDAELLVLYQNDIDRETKLFIQDVLQARGLLPPKGKLLFFS